MPFGDDGPVKILYPSDYQHGHIRAAAKCAVRDEVEAMRARIEIMLKNGVLDPQGKAIEGALLGLGFGGVGSVRQGKVIEIELAETNRDKARSEVERMCETLLANTVIENYSIEVV